MSEPINDEVLRIARQYDDATDPSAWAGLGDRSVFYHRHVLIAEVDRLRAELLARVDAAAAIDDDLDDHPLERRLPKSLGMGENGPANLSQRDGFDPPPAHGDVRVETIAAPPGVRATFVPDVTRGYGATEDEAMRDLYDKLGLPVPCVCGDSVHSVVGTCPTADSSHYRSCPKRKVDPHGR